MKRMWRGIAGLFIFVALTAGTVLAGEYESGAVSGEAPMTHRMMVLAIQLGIILFVAKLCSGLFEKIRLPGVLGEIGGGILIGPYLMGALPLPSLPHGLFPISGAFPNISRALRVLLGRRDRSAV